MTDRLYAGEWVSAPTTSRIESFRFYDSRLFGLPRSEIHVRFRGREPGRAATYVYFIDSAEAAEQLAVELLNSPHPFGRVVLPKLVRSSITFRRVDR